MSAFMLRVCCVCKVVIGCYINGESNDCETCQANGECEIPKVVEDVSHGLCTPCFSKKMAELKNK